MFYRPCNASDIIVPHSFDVWSVYGVQGTFLPNQRKSINTFDPDLVVDRYTKSVVRRSRNRISHWLVINQMRNIIRLKCIRANENSIANTKPADVIFKKTLFAFSNKDSSHI